jgi:hypothetical protein
MSAGVVVAVAAATAKNCRGRRPPCRSFSEGRSPANGANGMSDIEGKVAREAMSEWSRGDASDIDGKTERSRWAGAHESMWASSEFQNL